MRTQSLIIAFALLSAAVALPIEHGAQVEQLSAEERIEAQAQQMAQAQAFQQALLSKQEAFHHRAEMGESAGKAKPATKSAAHARVAASKVQAPAKVKAAASPKRNKVGRAAKKKVDAEKRRGATAASGKQEQQKKQPVPSADASKKKVAKAAPAAAVAAKRQSKRREVALEGAVSSAQKAMEAEKAGIHQQLVRVGHNAAAYKKENREILKRSKRLARDMKELGKLIPDIAVLSAQHRELGEILLQHPKRIAEAAQTASADLRSLVKDASRSIHEESAAKKWIDQYEHEAGHVLNVLHHSQRPSRLVKEMIADEKRLPQKVDSKVQTKVLDIQQIEELREELKSAAYHGRKEGKQEAHAEAMNMKATIILEQQASKLQSVVDAQRAKAKQLGAKAKAKKEKATKTKANKKQSALAASKELLKAAEAKEKQLSGPSGSYKQFRTSLGESAGDAKEVIGMIRDFAKKEHVMDAEVGGMVARAAAAPH